MSKLQSPLLSAAVLAVLLGLSSAGQAAPSTEPIKKIFQFQFSKLIRLKLTGNTYSATV